MPQPTEDHHLDHPEHHGGWRADLPLLLGRRRALALLGGAGLATLVGCASDGGAGSAATSTSPTSTGGPATTAAAGAGCTPIPEETAGPYPGDGSNGPDVLGEDGVVRRDITSSFGDASGTAGGVPLAIELSLVDSTGSCAPFAGAAVYLWHCDREGRYSLYSSGVTGENYLRGVQVADDAGQVRFESIFPACYPGRWPHIHFEVFETLAAATSGGSPIATSQVALPAAWSARVYATEGYEESVAALARVSLAGDNVFGEDDGVRQLGTVTGSVADGLTVALTVPVDPTATSSSRNAPGSDGAPPGAPSRL